MDILSNEIMSETVVIVLTTVVKFLSLTVNKYFKMLYGNKENETPSINIGHQNLGHGRLDSQRRTAELAALLDKHQVHILGISESKYEDTAPQFKGFTWERGHDKRINVLVSQDISYKRRYDLEHPGMAALWLEVGRGKLNSFLICNIYRSWSLKSEEDSRSLNRQFERWCSFIGRVETAMKTGKEILILGDFNLDANRWSGPRRETWKLKRLLVELENRMLRKGFTQMVQQDTRTGFTGASRLDLVLTNKRSRLRKVWTHIEGDNDHSFIQVQRILKKKSLGVKEVRTRKWSKLDYDKLRADFDHEALEGFEDIEDVDVAVDKLTGELQRILDLQSPMKVSIVRERFCGWMTKDLRKQISKRNRLHKQYRRETTVENLRAWRQQRNFVNREVKRSIRNYNERKVQEAEEDSQKLWKYSKSSMGWGEAGSPTSLVDQGTVTTDNEQIAEIMNNFFVTKVEKIKENIPKEDIDPMELTDMWLSDKDVGALALSPVTEETVENILKRLQNSNAAGEDDISTTVLKKLSTTVSRYFKHIINQSFITCRFPDRWKEACVTPLFKGKGSVLEPSGYRPVAILDSGSKVLEKAVNDQLVKHLEDRNLLTDRQHGFRNNRSTQSATLQLLDTVIADCSAKDKYDSLLVCCDCSAAFDTISHGVLLKKLDKYGGTERFIRWFTDYLGNRRQRVRIGGKQSKLRRILQGVFQGSILGPLLFILYLNDMCVMEQLFTFLTVIMFADDTSFRLRLMADPAENQLNLNNVTRRVSSQMNVSQLKFNGGKTTLMTMSIKEKFPNAQITLVMDGKQIEQSKVERFLGIWIPRNLRFKEHIENHVMAPVTSRISGLKNLAGKLSKKSLKVLGHGIVTSKLAYGICVWSNCLSGYKDRLQILQNDAAREILGVRRADRISKMELMNQVGWLTFDNLCRYMDILQVRSIIKTGQPESLASKLPTQGRTNRRMRSNTQGKINPMVDTGRVDMVKDFFTQRAVREYNALPDIIRSQQSKTSFKVALKKFLQPGIIAREPAQELNNQ